MAMSKKDLHRLKQSLLVKVAELEKKVRLDPLKKNQKLWTEYEQAKKDLAKCE